MSGDEWESWIEMETVRRGGSPWALFVFGCCLIMAALTFAVLFR